MVIFHRLSEFFSITLASINNTWKFTKSRQNKRLRVGQETGRHQSSAIIFLLLLPFPHPWYFSFPGSQWQLVLQFWDSMTTTTTPYLGQRPPTAWMRCVQEPNLLIKSHEGHSLLGGEVLKHAAMTNSLCQKVVNTVISSAVGNNLECCCGDYPPYSFRPPLPKKDGSGLPRLCVLNLGCEPPPRMVTPTPPHKRYLRYREWPSSS